MDEPIGHGLAWAVRVLLTTQKALVVSIEHPSLRPRYQAVQRAPEQTALVEDAAIEPPEWQCFKHWFIQNLRLH